MTPTGKDPVTYAFSPLVYRRRLRTELRAAREAANLTQGQVVQQMDWSPSKINRIESGEVSIATNDLKALLSIYHITDERRVAALVALGQSSRKSSWLAKYRDSLSSKFQEYAEYEPAASVIQNFEPTLIPGLLQTREYAEVALNQLNLEPSIIRDALEVRLTRQQLLEQPESPLLFAIIDEAAIRSTRGYAFY